MLSLVSQCDFDFSLLNDWQVELHCVSPTIPGTRSDCPYETAATMKFRRESCRASFLILPFVRALSSQSPGFTSSAAVQMFDPEEASNCPIRAKLGVDFIAGNP